MFTVTTIAHKTSDSSHPLIMVTNREGQKYFFGKVPEGSQRILNENKVKLGKLKSIFLTGAVNSWSELSGLPGLFLTISDSTKKSIDVFANSLKLFSFAVASWRYFVFRKGVELKILDTDENKIIADSNLIIRPIKTPVSHGGRSWDEDRSDKLFKQLKKLVSLMFPMDTSKVNDPNPYSYKFDPSETEVQTHVKLPDPVNILPVDLQPSLSYLIRFVPIRGKFNPNRAKELGIKPGIEFRNLTQGKTVVNNKGEIVRPEQVVEPPKKFSRILILDVPNQNYLMSTLNNEAWFSAEKDEEDEPIGMVYHLLGEDIDYELEQYLEFFQKFPKDCKHVISHANLSDDSLVFKTSAISLLKLKCLQPKTFNLPYFEPHKPLKKLLDSRSFFKLHHMQQFHINCDEVKYDDSLISSDTWSSLYDANIEPLKLTNVDKKQILEDGLIPLTVKSDSLKDQVQVVTLGTGSALPSIHRNVISTLIRVPYSEDGQVKFRAIMLDGGENTLGSMMRNFGHNNKQQLIEIFKELSLIHLSHLHADHHLGIISIINKWFEVNRDTTNKLFLIIPWQYNNFVHEWYSLEKQANEFYDLSRIVYISCEDFVADRQPQFKQYDFDEFEQKFDNNDFTSAVPRAPLAPRDDSRIREMLEYLHLKSVLTVRAIHCYWAYSISLTFQLSPIEKFKVSYSGDTRPNPKFVEIGRGSDLLIHESSLDHELIEEAIAKKHSTMIEAITVSKLMQCSKVILTHFSTRYSNKATLMVDSDELNRLASHLKNYLIKYGSSPNIFLTSEETSSARPNSYNDLDVCFAFDLMSVRLNDICLQKHKYKNIIDIFHSDDDLVDELKREKELQKQREKREAKRLQRMAFKNQKKKRRVSSDDDSN